MLAIVCCFVRLHEHEGLPFNILSNYEHSSGLRRRVPPPRVPPSSDLLNGWNTTASRFRNGKREDEPSVNH